MKSSPSNPQISLLIKSIHTPRPPWRHRCPLPLSILTPPLAVDYAARTAAVALRSPPLGLSPADAGAPRSPLHLLPSSLPTPPCSRRNLTPGGYAPCTGGSPGGHRQSVLLLCFLSQPRALSDVAMAGLSGRSPVLHTVASLRGSLVNQLISPLSVSLPLSSFPRSYHRRSPHDLAGYLPRFHIPQDFNFHCPTRS